MPSLLPPLCPSYAIYSLRLILVDELLDGTPVVSFDEVDGESTMLLPQYSKSSNSADEKLAKFVKWTVNVNLLIVSTPSLSLRFFTLAEPNRCPR